jgi:hypothetical protein
MSGMKKLLFRTPGSGFDRAGPLRLRDGASREAGRLAGLAAQYEDLLDQVWRREREWKLDDRVAYACRRRR